MVAHKGLDRIDALAQLACSVRVKSPFFMTKLIAFEQALKTAQGKGWLALDIWIDSATLFHTSQGKLGILVQAKVLFDNCK